MKALLVEDNEVAREVVADIMGHYGHAIEAAHSAEEALDRLSGEQFDVVIVDLKLPGTNGWDLARTIQDWYQVPCVAITAYHSGEVESAVKAQDSGFLAYFPKPLDELTFAQELESLL